MWVTSEIVDPEIVQAMELSDGGKTVREIGMEMKMSKSKVQRLLDKGRALRQAEQDASK